MKKIDIYIIKKFLGTFFFAISLLAIIVIIFDISEKIDEFLEKEAPFSEIVFSYYLNFIPYFINLFSYLFTFIAVIFFTSKMASNTEIIAILSSGVSFRRFLVPYFISAIVLAIMSFYLANFLIPQTNKKLLEFEKTYLRNARRNTDLNIHMQVSKNTFIYIENYNNFTNSGYKFSLEKFEDRKLVYKIMADRINWDSISENWLIYNYAERSIDESKEYLSSGRKMDTLLSIRPEDFTYNLDDVKVMNFWQLDNFISLLDLRGDDSIKEYLVEKHKRIAFPFATIVLTLIGVSLSSRKVRGGIGMHLGLGIGITFAFILFLQITTVFATYGDLSPMLAVWIPNIVFGILGIYLLRIAPK